MDNQNINLSKNVTVNQDVKVNVNIHLSIDFNVHKDTNLSGLKQQFLGGGAVAGLRAAQSQIKGVIMDKVELSRSIYQDCSKISFGDTAVLFNASASGL